MTHKTIAEVLSGPATKVAHSEDEHVNHISPIAKHKDLLLRLLGPLTIGLFIWHTLEQACDTKPYDTQIDSSINDVFMPMGTFRRNKYANQFAQWPP